MASNPSSDGNAQSQLEVAYQTLRSAIADLELGPDERLSEALLAKRYGFGRTPIREAVHRLRHDGLVVSSPRRGLFVSSLTGDDVREIYEILEALDGTAAYLATERHDADGLARLEDLNDAAVRELERGEPRTWQQINLGFHHLLVELAANRRLLDIFDLFYTQLRRALLLTLPLRGDLMPSMHAHSEMLEAMHQRDAELARQIAQRHRRQVQEDVIAALDKIELPHLRY